MENKKVLLSVKDLHVKFRVRGRILTAIRGISLDFYENESVAIVGESGSGKSVFTKTFAGMLDANGFIDNGSIIFNDEELSDTRVANDAKGKRLVASVAAKLNAAAKLELGSDIWNQMEQLKKEKTDRESLSAEETEKLTKKISDLQFQRTELFNQRQTVDRKNEKARYKELGEEIKAMDAQIKALRAEEKRTVAIRLTAGSAEKLKRLAAQAGISASDVIEGMISKA